MKLLAEKVPCDCGSIRRNEENGSIYCDSCNRFLYEETKEQRDDRLAKMEDV